MPSKKILIGVAALAGLGLAARARGGTPSEDPTGGRPLDFPTSARQVIDGRDGSRIAIWITGEATATPVLLSHGWTGDHRLWAEVTRQLVDQGFRVVSYDQRGHGESAAGSEGLTIAALGADMAAIIEALDLSALRVAGHSMGGMTTMRFAIDHADLLAERVDSLTLVSTAASKLILLPGSSRLLASAAASPRLEALSRGRLGSPLVRAAHGRNPHPALLEATKDTLLKASAEVKSEFIHEFARLDLSEGLASVHLPTTILVGSRDLLTPPARARDLHRLIPGSRLEMLAGLGHQLPFEAPGRIAAAIAGPLPS